MGTVSYAWRAALRKLGVTAYIPPYTNKRTLSLGTKYAPESICLPYKLILGNFIEAIEGGADYVSMITSPGICRLGEYGQLIETVLKDLGYQDKYLEMSLYDGFKGMYDYLSKANPKADVFKKMSAIYAVVKYVFALDRINSVLSYYRARELKPGTAEKAFNRGLDLIDKSSSIKELKKAEAETIKMIKDTPIDEKRDVLYVDITGEIYIVLDDFSNQNLNRELGRMGVQTRTSLTVSSFLKDAIIPKWLKKGETHLERAFRLAKPYLMRDIGGDSLESVSDVAFANERGIDGIIHISPFTCMPEIVSQNIFPKMRENCDIPILTLIMDEQTGKAGYITRLEAFTDLMRRKKRKKEKDKIQHD
ncbi:MAG: acyl-CoA dehydratase activase-related protein [Candidatus Gastranaerophilales bacterium]|nr:acyl-CoA dehydratase activase-related protein [Candidatus Gastranaerophilales bacterium]